MASIPNIYNGNAQNIGNAFMKAKTYVPLCGFLQNPFYSNGKTQAAMIPTDLLGMVSATAVKIINDTTPTSGRFAGENLNPKALKISAKAAAKDDLSGFVLETDADVIPANGGASLPIQGGFVQVGLLGSGLQVWLPCDDSLIGVAINSELDYDFATGKLKKGAAGAGIGVKLLSGVVDGKVKQYATATDTASWADTKCVLVQL